MKPAAPRPKLQTKNFIRPAVIALLIFIIPLIATNTVEGFNWGPGDFVGMGLFIYTFALTFEVAMVKIRKYKILVGELIAIIFIVLYGLMATTE